MDHYIDLLVPIRELRRRERLSERELAASAGLSRGALRGVEAGADNARLGTFAAAAAALGMRVQLLAGREDGAIECSSVAVSMQVLAQGFVSWRQHFMNLVDEFRRTLDPRLIVLPPARLDPRLSALLAGIVCTLCEEARIDAPEWARKPRFLAEPWFPAASESLKASALLESPIAFRRNNVFVLGNFLERA